MCSITMKSVAKMLLIALVVAALLCSVNCYGSDFWVNGSTGSDTPSAGTKSNPWRTITYALARVGPSNSIRVAGGTYDLAHGETFPLQIPRAVSVVGESRGGTVIRGVSSLNVIQYHNKFYGADSQLVDLTVSGGAIGISSLSDSVQLSPRFRGLRVTGNDIGIQISASNGFTNGTQLSRCLVDGNRLGIHISSIFLGIASPALVSSIVRDNAEEGVAMTYFAAQNVPLVLNSTIAFNGGVGLRALTLAVNPTVTNSVFYGNSADIENITIDETSHCCFSGGFFGGQNGNIVADPIFRDIAARDLRLSATSPCIDTGTNNVLPALEGIDINRYSRFLDGNLDQNVILDMGANEFSNVNLSIDGVPSIGGTITLHSRGLPGLPLLLIIGFAQASLYVDPYGTLLVAPGPIPWRLVSWGTVPSDVTTFIPNEPALIGLDVYFQEIGIVGTQGIGNFSSRVKMTFQ